MQLRQLAQQILHLRCEVTLNDQSDMGRLSVDVLNSNYGVNWVNAQSIHIIYIIIYIIYIYNIYIFTYLHTSFLIHCRYPRNATRPAGSWSPELAVEANAEDP
jgi:hypothetical protein